MTTTSFKAIFEIAEQINCPLYEKGERMCLSERTFSCPEDKEVCLILVRDMSQLLFQLVKEDAHPGDTLNKTMSCSGCSGLIKFRRIRIENEEDEAKVIARIDTVMQEIHGWAVDSAFLQALPGNRLTTILKTFQEVSVARQSVLIREGEANPNLYLVLAGSFIVENNSEVIATLGVGEIFGEMSYLRTGQAAATVRAVVDSSVLAITAEDFGRLLDKVASVQEYMARLLAERLQQLNVARARDLESCMSGRLDEVVPAELFQVFHMHQKTGVLLMNLAYGEARVSFREGCIINAAYGKRSNQEAIFTMLAERQGTYRFTTGLSPQEMKAAEIGDFMALLMEGVKRVDEVS